MKPDTPNNNLVASGWLLTDICIALTAMSMVKMLDGGLPSVQLVFIRASMGLVLTIPFVLSARLELQLTKDLGLHILRFTFAAITLSLSFYAVANLPLALFTTLNFTRPLLLMVFAALLLGERIFRLRWIAGIAGLIGAAIAINPQNVEWSTSLGALLVAIVIGTLGIIVLRKMKGCPWQTAMLYYTGGMTVLTAIPALLLWSPPNTIQWPIVLMLGVFSQVAQFCFMRAQWLGDAGVLGPLGYIGLVLSIGVGFVFFQEIPTLRTILGAIIIILATLLLSRKSESPVK